MVVERGNNVFLAWLKEILIWKKGVVAWKLDGKVTGLFLRKEICQGMNVFVSILRLTEWKYVDGNKWKYGKCSNWRYTEQWFVKDRKRREHR